MPCRKESKHLQKVFSGLPSVAQLFFSSLLRLHLDHSHNSRIHWWPWMFSKSQENSFHFWNKTQVIGRSLPLSSFSCYVQSALLSINAHSLSLNSKLVDKHCDLCICTPMCSEAQNNLCHHFSGTIHCCFQTGSLIGLEFAKQARLESHWLRDHLPLLP